MRIEGRGLACLRGGRLVFRDLDIEVAGGSALLLRGPNGAGKSTLLRVLAGLLRPDAGRIAIGGEDVTNDPVAVAGRVALLGHLDAVKPGLDCAENLAFAARIAGAARARIAEVLGEMGLAAAARLPARLLSAGQKRRLAIARVVLSGRPVWLLDEPASGLDDASLARLGAAMERHLGAGGSIVASTHVALPLARVDTLGLGGGA